MINFNSNNTVFSLVVIQTVAQKMGTTSWHIVLTSHNPTG